MALTPDVLPWLRFRDPGLGLIYFPCAQCHWYRDLAARGTRHEQNPGSFQVWDFHSMRPSQITRRPGSGRRGAQQRTQQGRPGSGHWSMGWGSLGPKIWTDGCHQLYTP